MTGADAMIAGRERQLEVAEEGVGRGERLQDQRLAELATQVRW